MKRKHQIEMESIVDGIIAGDPVTTIICKVAPGGGKSALPIIAGKLIGAGLADAICWVCPRKSLQHQGETNFQDPFFRELFSHRLSIRSATNDANPCRGLNGFITTYQAIGVENTGLIRQEFSRKRYILVLDEFHHVEDGGIWHEALAPIVSLAKYLVLMTGTMARGNRRRIAFAPYCRTRPSLNPASPNVRAIEYTRKNALAERAIIPLRFIFKDGAVSWKDKASGKITNHGSFKAVSKCDASRAVYTAISTQYAKDMMESALNHWAAHRARVNPYARLLVVTANYKHARAAIEFIKGRFYYAEIATSHETEEATRAIRRFKSGKINIFVSIAMAYEGFDCKEVSHIICLTHIRSVPWIEQMIARAVRVDPHLRYEDQYGYIFAPDDALFQEIVAQIQAEQLPFIKNRAPRKQALLFDPPGCDNSGETGAGVYITPLDSRMTGEKVIAFDEHCPAQAPAAKPAPSDREKQLLASIEKHIRQYAFQNYYNPKRINTQIREHFGKPRADMSIPELESVCEHIIRAYPLSQWRGSRRRPRYTDGEIQQVARVVK